MSRDARVAPIDYDDDPESDTGAAAGWAVIALGLVGGSVVALWILGGW